MDKPEDLDSKLFSIDIENTENVEQTFNLFYHNFVTILKNILENGCQESGYNKDSPIFNTEQIRQNNFQEICLASRNLIKTEDYTKWPDIQKTTYLSTAFTTFMGNQNLYKEFLTNTFKKTQDIIGDVFIQNQHENIRRIIYNLEMFIIAILNRSQLNRIESELRGNCESLVSVASKEIEEYKQYYNTISQNGDYSQENLDNLIARIRRGLHTLKDTAVACNILSQLIPRDTKSDNSKFTFKGASKMITTTSSLLIELTNIVSIMEGLTWEGEKFSLTEDEEYKKRLEELSLGKNLKFKVTTKMPEFKFLDVKPTEAENSTIRSPRPLSPIDVPPLDTDDEEDGDETNSSLSGGDGPILKPKNTNKIKKEKTKNQYEMVFENLKESRIRAENAMNSGGLKKIKATNLSEDLKNSLKEAKNTLTKELPPNEAMKIKFKKEIKNCTQVQDALSDLLDELAETDTLRRSLPTPAWAQWDGSPETYLAFKKNMLVHLSTLATEELRLATLKANMKGERAKEIIRKLSGISTLEKFFSELDKQFGSIERLIPRKLEELKKMKPKPQGKLQELENVEKLLSYVRVCQSYSAGDHINLVFASQFAIYLCEENAMKLINTKGDTAEITQLLEKISLDDQIYKELQPQQYTGGRWRHNNMKNQPLRKCRVCGEGHILPKCPYLEQKKSQYERESMLKQRKLCFRCLKQNTFEHHCPDTGFICKVHNRNGLVCGCHHRKGKNDGNITAAVTQQSVQNNKITLNNSNGTDTNLMTEVINLMDKNGRARPVLVLYDTGNTNTGICSAKANQLYGYQKPIGKIKVDNILAGTELVDYSRREIIIIGKNKTETISVYAIENLNQQFPVKSYTIPDEWMKEYGLIKNPKSAGGLSTLVIGLDTPHLLPKDLDDKISDDGVILMKSRITGDIIVAGRTNEQGYGSCTNNKMVFHPISNTHEQMYKNISTDGIESSRLIKCEKCILLSSKCIDCKRQNKPVPKEQIEYSESVKKNINYNPETKKYSCQYIYNPELQNLPTNEEPVLRMMKSFEAKIEELGLTLELNKAYSKFRQGVIVLDSEEPLNENLQRSFIPMCYSLSSNDYKSTKFRICMNSSFKKSPNTVSINECMITGPAYLNDMHSILTRWRLYSSCAYSDIKAAYHQIQNSEKDKALRSLWVKPSKFGREFGEPWVKGYCAACQFGDKLAGAFCTYCILDCAERFMKPHNKKQLQSNIMMDDILLGDFYSKENLKENVQDVDQGLQKGSLMVKGWSFSKEKSDLTKFLSYMYDSESDTFSLRTNFNWSKIKRGARSGPPIEDLDNIEEYFKKYPLTKKAMASIVMGACHDPLQIVAPFTNNLKFLYSKAVKENLDWNQEVSKQIKVDMIKAIKTMFGISKLKFPRQVAFIEATSIEIITYFDGSLTGIGCSTVIKNMFENGKTIIRLLKNKCRVAGKDITTAPRAELLACLIATRLHDTLKYDLSEFLNAYTGKISVKFIGDSSIVLNQIVKSSHLFKMWAQTKIEEIQQLSKKFDDIEPQFLHCTSENNLADILTRPYHVTDYLPWIDDLSDVEAFPVKTLGETSKLPEINKRSIQINSMMTQQPITLNQIAFYNQYTKVGGDAVNSDTEDIIDALLLKISNYFKARNILTRIIIWGDKDGDFSKAQKKAENMIVKHYQQKRKDYLSKFDGGPYHKTTIDGVITLMGRKTPTGQTMMKLIPTNTLLYNRISRSFHERYELSPQYIQCQMIKSGFYLPAAIKRLKKIQRNCGKCRRRLQQISPPEMGMLGDKRTVPSRPFKYVQMDLSGPHYTKSRTTPRAAPLKFWILLCICDYTRMIALTMVENLSRDALMRAMITHMTRYGVPDTIESDLGTNFKSVKKQSEMEDERVNDDDLKILKQNLQSYGVKFIQRAPKSPWIQGSAEFSVKMTKKALRYFKSPLTTTQWVATLEKAQKIINRRPIGLATTGEMLTPDDLNPVHSTSHFVPVDQDQTIIQKYKDLADQMLMDFSKKWLEFYYSSIIQQKKWTGKGLTFEENDIVYILDMKTKFGYPVLGKVALVQLDSAKIPRYISISYKTGKTWRTVIRTPQNLSIILKENEDQEVNKFDIPNAEIRNEILVESDKPTTKRLKVKVLDEEQTDSIVDIHQVTKF